MCKRNIIIIAISFVILIISILLFTLFPRERFITSDDNKESIASTPTPNISAEGKEEQPAKSKAVKVQKPDADIKTEKSEITASEYSNFEKTIDLLIPITEEEN